MTARRWEGSCAICAAAPSSAVLSSRPSRIRLKMETKLPSNSRGFSISAMKRRTDGDDNCSSRFRSSWSRTRLFSSAVWPAVYGGFTKTTSVSSIRTDQPWLARSHRTCAAAARLGRSGCRQLRLADSTAWLPLDDGDARACANDVNDRRSDRAQLAGAGSAYQSTVISGVHEGSEHVRPGLPQASSLPSLGDLPGAGLGPRSR